MRLTIRSLAFENLMSSINEPNTELNERSLALADSREIYSWREINQIHKVRHGIYQRSGRLISLLTDFGKINPCYPDAHGGNENTILYTGAGRRGDQPLDSFNEAMFNAIRSKHYVPLFNKLSAGHWQFLGFWRVVEGAYIYDETQKRMVWKFTLKRNDRDKKAD